MVSSRGGDDPAALAEAVGERRRERPRALVHRVPAGLGEHVVGGDGRGRRLGRQRGRVVPAGVGVQRRLERAPRLGEVHVRRADREDVLTPVGSDPQHPGPDRPAQPLLARARVEGAAERPHVDRHRADALGAVEQDRHASIPSSARPAGRTAPVTQFTCEHATSRVRRPTASARSSNGAVRTSTPRRARSDASGPSRPGCSSGAVRTSSPGPSDRPARTRTTPSLVLLVSATSAGSAPSRSAYAARWRSRSESIVSMYVPRAALDRRAARARRRPRAARGAAADRTCRR